MSYGLDADQVRHNVWVEFICKDHQQMANLLLVGKELNDDNATNKWFILRRRFLCIVLNIKLPHLPVLFC